ncbi:hypothetical protein Hamer_G005543 [Homarus americanus]|uniref:Uncharacterized protein n=1 Tax=Homarus americanus TaxID=6706 RepID=A0A8J5JXS8_HOMAM|nr:hypothetical protein Hamer_G005543 [Homarus americanus]
MLALMHQTPKNKKEIMFLYTKQVGFAEVESAMLRDCSSPTVKTADLQQLVAAGEIEDAKMMKCRMQNQKVPTSLLSSILREVDKQLQLLENNDVNADRSRIALDMKTSPDQLIATYQADLLCGY